MWLFNVVKYITINKIKTDFLEILHLHSKTCLSRKFWKPSCWLPSAFFSAFALLRLPAFSMTYTQPLGVL